MPLGVVTSTGPVVAPVGMSAKIWVGAKIVKLAGVPLKVMLVVPVRSFPMISIYSSTGLATGDVLMNGTTRLGGANDLGTIFQIARGVCKSLKSLSASDGASPCSALTQATDGNLYGTTTGGQVDNGTVYRLSMGLVP